MLMTSVKHSLARPSNFDQASPMTLPAAHTPESRTSGGVRVMVVDDSAVVRGLISRQIDAQPDLSVVASAANGEMALVELRRHGVDVVILDIEMPVMDGLTALPRILAEWPDIKVVVASNLTRLNAEVSMRALHLGASDCVAKPTAGDPAYTTEDFNRDLVAKVLALGTAGRKPASPVLQASPPPSPRRAAVAPSLRPEIIAIGGSTGAPPVLVRLFEGLRGQVKQPIVLTQHMPPMFTALLAEQLERAGGRPCAEGRDGEVVQPGRAYVAPGGWHMVVERIRGQSVIRLNQNPPENFCRPAVDPLFRSVAEIYGGGVLAILLTGMGADGARGCEAIARAGGRFAVQDEATSAVWGMPGAAARTGLADRILPQSDIAPYVAQIAETGL